MRFPAYLSLRRAEADFKALVLSNNLDPRRKNIVQQLSLSPTAIEWRRCKLAEMAWSEISVSTWDDNGDEEFLARCYYQPMGTNFIVSDCCEFASRFMVKTGRAFTEAWHAARAAMVNVLASKTFDYEWIDGADLTLKGIDKTDLPAAIVAVLTAVSKCAEAK